MIISVILRSDDTRKKTYDFTWTDIQKPTRENISTLGSQYPFHELNLDDSLSKIHIPKVDKYKDHLSFYLIFQ